MRILKSRFKGAGQRKLRFANLHLKGAGVAWIFGLMMALVVMAVFAVGANIHYDTQTTIGLRTSVAYKTLDAAELAKRTLDGACLPNAETTVEELAANGGGFPDWTAMPEMEQLAAKAAESMQAKTDYITFTSLGKRSLSWDYANVSITKYDDNSFAVSGTKPFTVENAEGQPLMTIENKGAFECAAASDYFRLLRLGRAAAACPLAAGTTTVEGYEQNIIAGNNSAYSVSIGNAGGIVLKFEINCGTAPLGSP